jgi:hypothetical protein
MNDLIDLLDEAPLSTLISQLNSSGATHLLTPQLLRSQHSRSLKPYSDEQLFEALRRLLAPQNQTRYARIRQRTRK